MLVGFVGFLCIGIVIAFLVEVSHFFEMEVIVLIFIDAKLGERSEEWWLPFSVDHQQPLSRKKTTEGEIDPRCADPATGRHTVHPGLLAARMHDQ